MSQVAKRVILVGLLLSFAALAQRDLGTIVGTVTDPTGSVVANAKVTITEESTGLKYQLETNSEGVYVRTALKPSTYTVEVEATGFKKAIQKGVILTAGDRTAANMSMTVGDVTQSVEITEAAPLLQSESTIIGTSINSKNTSELPLGGQRKFSYLARLSPNVVPAEPGARDAAGGGFSANGVRSNGQNNFLLNGVDNNVNVIDFLNQTSYVIGPSVEAIDEIRVLTNGYNAEYGRGAGGVVNVTIKSGTNEIHGRVFEFLQNDKLDANKWESNKAGQDRGPFKQNQYGVAVGGPIIKNRTFWFADYQGTKIRSSGGAVPGLGGAFTGTVPTPAMKNGDYSALLASGIAIYDINSQVSDGKGGYIRTPFPGNIIPPSRFDPAAKKIMDLFPNPNINTGIAGRPSNNFYTVTSGTQDVDQWDIRIDHKISDKDSIFGSLSWSTENKFNTPPLPGALDGTYFSAAEEHNLGRNANLSYVRVWTPAILSETRVAFSRLVTSRTQANPNVDQFKAFGIGGYNPTTSLNGGLPSTNIDGYSGIGASDWLPSKEFNNVWDFIQNVSINKGSHAYKFGAEFRPIKFPFFQVPSPHGNITFAQDDTSQAQESLRAANGDGSASFLLGQINRGQISSTNFISSEKSAWAFYAQDDWKFSRKLTINLGIRYELFSPISERFGRQSNYVLDSNTLFIPKGKDQNTPLPPNFATAFPGTQVSRGAVTKYLIGWDKTNFAPRIGLAYQVMNKTVIRAGFGIFYGGEENQGGYPNRGEAAPFNITADLSRPNNLDKFQKNPYFAGGLSGGFPTNVFTLPVPISFRGISTNFRTPLVQKWNFAVQREFARSMALELSYVGNHQSHQVVNWDPNSAPFLVDPTGKINSNTLRKQPAVGGIAYTDSIGYGNYHALAAKLEKRYSNGLDFTMAYTYGHVLSNVGTTLSGSNGFGTPDPLNLATAYSSAAWDIRHSFTTSFVYDLPFGRGRMFGSNMNPVANAVLGGWQANGILSFRTGSPITIRSGSCTGIINGACRPDVVSGKDPKNAPSNGRSPDQWFDISAVKIPAPNTQGNLGLQAINGPGIGNVDMSLFKDVKLSDRFKIQFRAESFNLTNSPQFGAPDNNANYNAAGQLTNGNFGKIGGTVSGSERHYQFSLRFMF